MSKWRLTAGVRANYPAYVYRPQSVLAPAGFDDVSGDIPHGLEPLLSVGDRLPNNHQLDVRIDKKWFLKSSMLTTYIDIQNVYNQANVFNQRYDYEQGKAVNNEGFGILPSIGISFEF